MPDFGSIPISGGRRSQKGPSPDEGIRAASPFDVEQPIAEYDPFDVYQIPGITEEQDDWYRQTMQQMLGPWMQMLSGQPDLGALDTLYKESIYGPGEREMEQSIIPKTRAAFTGPGFWGTPRAEAEGRAWGDFESDMGARRGELYAGAYQQSQQNAISALGPWMQMLGFETFTPMLSENFPDYPSFGGGTSISTVSAPPKGLGASFPELGVSSPKSQKKPRYWR